MAKETSLPTYLKLSFIFIGLLAVIFAFYIGRGIIVPIIFSVILAMILHPVVLYFVKHRINRVIAIILTLTLAFLAISALGIFLASQISRFGESLPEFTQKFTELIHQAVIWLSGFLDISTQEINDTISKIMGDLVTKSSAVLGKTLLTLGSTLVLIILIPVYIFLLLFYKTLIVEFIYRLSGKNNRNHVSEILSKIKILVQDYLIGLLKEAGIIATLYFTGLMIIGMEYAILLAISGALLNMIPYIGAIMAAVLSMFLAIVTMPSPVTSLVVLAMYILIQVIDNNFLVPRIVASQVKLNALVTIAVVFAFGLLWAIPGMFLAIPLTGIIKVVCDQIDVLKPWGFLLGDTLPEPASPVNPEKSLKT